MRDSWIAALTRHLDHVEDEWDPSAALDPGMLSVAGQLRDVLGDDPADLDAWHLLGRFHMYRDSVIYHAGEDGWQADNDAMFDAFTRCFVAGADVPEDLRAPVADRAMAVALDRMRDLAVLSDAGALSEVAWLWQRIAAATPIDSPARASMMANLGIVMRYRYAHTADIADLDAAITVGKQALAVAAEDDQERPGIHLDVAAASLMRFELTSDQADLDRAVAGFQEALDGLPEAHPARPWSLSCYGISLRYRFEVHGDRTDLDTAVDAGQQAVAVTDERAVSGPLSALAATLLCRFSIDGQQPDIDAAITSLRQAIQVSPESGECLTSLSQALRLRFEWQGNPGDIEEAVAAGRRAIELTDSAHPDFFRYQGSLATALMISDLGADDSAVLEEAARIMRQAVDGAPARHKVRPMLLSNLSLMLWQLAFRSRDLAELDAAIAMNRQAVDAIRPAHPDRFRCLNSLFSGLLARYELTDDIADIDQTIAVGRQLLAEAPEGEYAGAQILPLLASALRDRFEATDRVEDLDEAIALYRRAIASVPDGQPARLETLANTGRALRARFDETGKVADLDEALMILQRAADETAAAAAKGDITDDGAALASLAGARLAKHRLTGEAGYLESAIETARRALAASSGNAEEMAGNQSLLSRMLAVRFELTGREADLAEAVALARQAVDATSVGHPSLASFRLTLGEALQAQARSGPPAPGSADPGERSELIARMAALVNLKAASDLPVVLTQAAADDARRLGDLLARDGSRDLGALRLLGRYHWLAYHALGREGDKDARVKALNIAIDSYVPVFRSGQDVPADLRPDVAAIAAARASEEFDEVVLSGDAGRLTDAIAAWRRIVATVPADDLDYGVYLGMLGSLRCARFPLTGDQSDLDSGIAGLDEAVAILPGDFELVPMLRTALSEGLQARFAVKGNQDDLDRSLRTAELAVTDNAGAQENVYARGQLAGTLLTRYQVRGVTEDLDNAIEILLEVTNSGQEDDPTRWMRLMVLADALRCRYERTSDLATLDQAVQAGTQAVAAAPAGQPGRALAGTVLGTALLARAGQRGQRSDLDTAISVLTEGTQITGPAHPVHGDCLGGLGRALTVKFSWTGLQADIDAAISTLRQALTFQPPGHATSMRLTGMLGAALLARFELAGSSADLESALVIWRAAADSLPPGHPDRAYDLYNLASALQLQFMRTDSLEVLDESIAAARLALESAPISSAQQVLCLLRLATGLRLRCVQTEDLTGIDEAVAVSRQALSAAAAGQAMIQGLLVADLASALWVRHLGTDDQADLEEAIAALRSAIQAAHGTAIQPNLQFLLAEMLDSAYEDRPAAEFRDEAISLYTVAAAAASAAPAFRIEAARDGARLAVESDPARAADLFESAVRLLPQLASLQLSQADRQYALGQVTLVASEAAEAVLIAGGPAAAARALGLLELGRAVLQGQALDGRTDLLELHARHPELAGQFLKLRDRLDAQDASVTANPAELMASPASHAAALAQSTERFQAGAELAGLLDAIRRLDGFESFLLPPSPGDLIKHAGQGPIVAFNISRFRSDALIVTTDGIAHLPLPGLALMELVEHGDAWEEALDATTDPSASLNSRAEASNVLSEILEWLWDAAAEPVLSHLGIDAPPAAGEPWPRIWWATGGLLGLLPLHAAGYHRQIGQGRTVLDRAVSSYTPTIRALAYARERARSTPPRRSLIVAMPSTPGTGPEANLSFARAEAELLTGQLPSSTVFIEGDGELTDRTPTAEAVLKELASAGIAHFACHAFSHPDDPSQSQIVLHDHAEHPFTVASLGPVQLHHAQLAFLSACQTARSESFDLLDEAIHLTSAFQLIGFPHVIGTLWPIFDHKAVRVARAFYSRLGPEPGSLDLNMSAQALHGAIRELRDLPGAAGRPVEWAAHIHAGA